MPTRSIGPMFAHSLLVQAPPNQALQRTLPERPRYNSSVLWAGS
jgi:hypothetical protein